MDEEYSEETINRFQDPEYTGEIENADAVGKAGNPTCGDVLKIFLEIE
ncbi:MAG: iron-sulfur cluster assembly scaffold protein, partial [archaeon]